MIDKDIRKDPLEIFFNRLLLLKVFNVVYLLWLCADIVIYIITIVQIQCSQMQSLFVVWLCSVIVEISVPIMMFVIIWRLKYFVVCYTLIGISVAYKCACIITVHTIGSKPKGLCYIDFNYRTVLTLVSLLEISCLAINTVMIYRIKVANREQMVANIIRSKRFADNS